MTSIVEHAVKIPLNKVCKEEFKKLGYKTPYADDLRCEPTYDTWFLICRFKECKLGVCSKRIHPVTTSNIDPKKDCIYFYGGSFHEDPSDEQLEENIYVVNQILKTPATDKIRYKRYILKIVNILHFLDMTEMVFPKEALANINTLSDFFKDYFGITISRSV